MGFRDRGTADRARIDVLEGQVEDKDAELADLKREIDARQNLPDIARKETIEIVLRRESRRGDESERERVDDTGDFERGRHRRPEGRGGDPGRGGDRGGER